jgi:pectin methylesterase-like acyl-CoA thioesterase
MTSRPHFLQRTGLLSLLVVLLAGPQLRAATLIVTSLFPANGATDVSTDAKLIMMVNKTVQLNPGGVVQICRASDDVVVWQMTIVTTSNPPIAAGWPYQINLAGKTLNYVPTTLLGMGVEIYPPASVLQYDTDYYVNMTRGFIGDGSGSGPSPAMDATTWHFRTKAAAPAVDGEYVVAADGSGDFCTIQGAVNAVPDNSASRTVIKVKSGTYRELINVPSSKKKITLLGQDRDTTTIAAYNNNNFNNNGSSYRCMIQVNADDFRIYNMTFRNTTPQGGSQAETFYFNNVLRCLASNCRFYSYQDTLLITGTMYFADCYIEGDVDYMWGYGSAFFERCQLNTVRTGGYNLMPRNGQGVPGYIFLNCTLTAPAGISGVYLARDAGLTGDPPVPYFPYGQVVYIECRMGAHIAGIGWLIHDGYDPAKLFLAEYHSMDLAGNLLNVSGRDYRSRQLNATDAAYWGTVTNVLGGWDPTVLGELPTAAWQPQPANTAIADQTVTLKWAAGAAAASHIIYLDTVNPPAALYASTSVPTLAVGTLTPGVYYWRVDENNAAGTTAGQVWRFTAVTDGLAPNPDPMTWSIVPHATSHTSIEMVATTATDGSGVEYYFANLTDPAHDSGWQDSATYADTGLTPSTVYTYTVTARDKSPYSNTTATSVPKLATTSAAPDVLPPTPDPMTWFVPPHGIEFNAISMTATTETDASGVEYYFACTSGGGHDSGWQDSVTYVDTGLVEGATCTYTVQARDKSPNHNVNVVSAPASASTVSTAPTPNPMTFSVLPHAVGIDTITMTATDANDPSGAEYYFACTLGGGHDSGWQDSATYADTGLANNASYSYRVIARDKSLARNETLWSEPGSATTLRFVCTAPIAADLNGNCQVDIMDYALMAAAWSTPLPLTDNIVTNGTFDADAAGWELLDLPTAVGSLWTGFDPPYGNPPGAAYLMCDTSAGAVAGHYFYQVLPVTPGSRYRLSGEWMGDLTGASAPDPLTMSNNAEVTVAFEPGSDPAAWDLSDPALVKYAKVWGVGNINTDPNGTWAWEPMSQSRTNAPSDDVYIATEEYMVIAFSQGGITGPGMPWIDIDNIKVEGPGCPVLDLTSDCTLDWQDVQVFATDWLACNRNPAFECWTW